MFAVHTAIVLPLSCVFDASDIVWLTLNEIDR